MILEQETLDQFGYTANKTPSKGRVCCRCDYCGAVFNRLKAEVKRGRSVVDKDSCGSKECSLSKRRETNIAKYGVESYTQAESFKKKAKKTCMERYGEENYRQTAECKERARATCQEKYGVDHYHQTEECRERIKQTSLAKYGTEHHSQTKEWTDKVLQTSMERYGVDHYSKTEEYKERFAQTCLDRYGVTHPSHLPEVIEKQKETSIERYGSDHYSKTDEYLLRVKDTSLKKFGVANYAKTTECKQKMQETCLERYGVMFPAQNPEVKEKTEKTCQEKYGHKSYFGSKKATEDATRTCMERYGVSHYSQTKEFHERVGKTCLERYGVPNCFYLADTHSKKTEKEIGKFLEELGYRFSSNRTVLDGKEIDLYCPEIRLGIEYCGLYWHNEQSLSPRCRNYHYDKWKKCTEAGIRLVTLYENEWHESCPQVKGILAALMGKFEYRIPARKCNLFALEKNAARNFLATNHLLGVSRSSLHYWGLAYQDALVGVISFGRHHRQSGDRQVVLDRLCFAPGTQVIGGASRLLMAGLTWAKNEGYNSVISWSDNRWSSGGVYTKLGFKLDADLPPDYAYVNIKKGKIISKQSQKKSNTGCPKDVTEKEWATRHGLARIWDCGKKRWKMDLKP